MVNTNGRDYLLACLEAIERTHPAGVEHELLVLDNASDDGSADAVRERFPQARLIALERRRGKADNDSRLLQEASGRYCLLLNEDSELCAGAARALLDALEANPGAAAAGAQLLTSAGEPGASAWRLPDAGWALAAAVFLHRRYAVQSRGDAVREVGWVQSSAMLVRREAAEAVGWLDPDFFVYSDETDFCKRLHDAGWRILFVPAARAVHHDQLSTDAAAMRRRIVEFHRGRDLYFRKHGMPVTRLLWTVCWTWAYLVRAPPRRCCPATTRAATSCTRASSCGRGAARASARPRRRTTAGARTLRRAMEHADTAQLAAVAGALGSILVLLARGRLALLAGLLALALAEAGLALSLGDSSLDKLTSPAGAGAAVAGLALLGAAAAVLSRRPALVPVAVLVAAPFRPPLAFDSSNRSWSRWPRTVASGACCRSTSCSRPRPPRWARRAARPPAACAAARDRPAGGGLLRVRLPVAAVGRRRGGGRQPARLLHAAVRRPARRGGPRGVPGLGAARAGRGGPDAGGPVRARRALAGGHAQAVLLRAEPGRLEREHRLLPRHLAVRRPEPLRAPRGARHRRGAGAAGRAALAHLAAGGARRR